MWRTIVVYSRAIEIYSAVDMADERVSFRLRAAAGLLEKGGLVTATATAGSAARITKAPAPQLTQLSDIGWWRWCRR
jgi:hypothetical protein